VVSLVLYGDIDEIGGNKVLLRVSLKSPGKRRWKAAMRSYSQCITQGSSYVAGGGKDILSNKRDFEIRSFTIGV
jgi:hypothetical protein